MKKGLFKATVTNLAELRAFIDEVQATEGLPSEDTIVIEMDPSGKSDRLGSAELVEETLSDGSKVYNIVIRD